MIWLLGLALAALVLAAVMLRRQAQNRKPSKPAQPLDVATINISTATDEELRRLMGMTDEQLLRASRTLDFFTVAESMRRLRVALHSEETAIKWLTVALVVLTVALVGLGVEALRR